MKIFGRITILILWLIVIACSKDKTAIPAITKSNEANLLELVLESNGITYTTVINGTNLSLTNILPYFTKEVSIKSISISNKANTDKNIGDKLQISGSPLSIKITAENGDIKIYSLKFDVKTIPSIIPLSNAINKEKIILYELNFSTIGIENGFQNAINHLSHLEKLNVNVLWLMPVFPRGGENNGSGTYAVADYSAVNPLMGDFSDFVALINKAHEKKIAVIIDWEANHTSWKNPWIKNKDWYTQDGKGNIVSPNSDWTDVADLNYDNKDMRSAMIDAMKFWLNLGVDGFRCDAADLVPDDFWKSAIDELKKTNNNVIMLAEGKKIEQLNAGFDVIYDWDANNKLYGAFKNDKASTITYHYEWADTYYPKSKRLLHFVTNHDISMWNYTPFQYFGSQKSALIAIATTLFIGQVPLIYSSQEIGEENKVDFFVNDILNWNKNPYVFNEYIQLLNFYANSDIAKERNQRYFHSDNIVAFKKVLGTKNLIFISNVRNEKITYNVSSELSGTYKNGLTYEEIILGNQIQLEPYQYLILEK